VKTPVLFVNTQGETMLATIIAQSVTGAGILLVAFGGMVFGAIGTALVMGYVWGARASENERWHRRFRSRIRRRFQRRADRARS
jgi:hypothetical protein